MLIFCVQYLKKLKTILRPAPAAKNGQPLLLRLLEDPAVQLAHAMLLMLLLLLLLSLHCDGCGGGQAAA